MKKKMLWGSTILVIGVICFITYKFGTNFYKKYQFQKWEEEYQANSYKIDEIISSNAEKNLKLNDLIVVCELRKALWNSKTSINVIQMSAELVDDKYKKFSEVVKADLVANTNKDYFENSEDINTALIGKLCTQHYPDSPNIKNNVYSDLLSQKYKLNGDQDSIGYVDMSLITNEDLKKYERALQVEKNIRLKY